MKTSDRSLLVLFLLGPSLVLLSLLFVIGFSLSQGVYLGAVAFGGLLLSSCWRWKGLTLSWLVLAGVLGVLFSDLSIQDRFYHVGAGLTLALSFLVAFLSIEELRERMGMLGVQAKSRLENLKHLDEKLKAVQDENKELQNEMKLHIGFQNAARRKIEEKEKEIEISKKEIQRLLAIEESLREKIRLKTESIQSIRQELFQVLKEKENKPVDPKKEIPGEVRRWKGFYEELRKQFEEKKRVLEETRKQLFEVQESLLAYEKDQDEDKFSKLQDFLSQYQMTFASIDQEIEQLDTKYEQEVEALENLVGMLITSDA